MPVSQQRFDEIFGDENEFLKFERIANPLSRRRDLHAFLLFDKLLPIGSPIVCRAEHLEIFFDFDAVDLMKAATEQQLVELVRCGVRVDYGYGIYMTVSPAG